MPDNITLNPGAGGVPLATDDIAGIHYQRIKPTFGVADVAPTDVSLAAPLPTDYLALTSPQTSHAVFVALAAGASTDLDSAQISVGLTGQLVAIVMAATVPLKGQLFTVVDGVAGSVLATLFSWAGRSDPWMIPAKRFFTVAHSAGAGFDGFRLTVTNLDGTQAADCYATFLFDQV